MQTVLSMPSNPKDARFRAPRSRDCPNDIGHEEAHPAALADKAGLCGFCAWGFYSMHSEGPQSGEDTSSLQLLPLTKEGGGPLGYKAQCGRVSLYSDQAGRVGALRTVDGRERFFPGIKGNWAYERYVARTPELAGCA